jgi:hypothetical protein
VGAESHPGRRTCRWGPNPFISNVVTAYGGRSPSYLIYPTTLISQLPLGAESHPSHSPLLVLDTATPSFSFSPHFHSFEVVSPLSHSFRHVSLFSPRFHSFRHVFTHWLIHQFKLLFLRLLSPSVAVRLLLLPLFVLTCVAHLKRRHPLTCFRPILKHVRNQQIFRYSTTQTTRSGPFGLKPY